MCGYILTSLNKPDENTHQKYHTIRLPNFKKREDREIWRNGVDNKKLTERSCLLTSMVLTGPVELHVHCQYTICF